MLKFKLKESRALLGCAILAVSAGAYAVDPLVTADTISFDIDGNNEFDYFDGSLTDYSHDAADVGAFDWLVGSTLADGALSSQTGEYQVYSHGELAALANPDGTGFATEDMLGLNSKFEITYNAGFGESVDSFDRTIDATGGTHTLSAGEAAAINAEQGANTVAEGDSVALYEVNRTSGFGAATGEFSNFFEIYWDDLTDGGDADPLAGTGYQDGDLILSGHVTAINGDFGTTTIKEFIDVDGDGDFDFATDIIVSTGWAELDSFGGEDWDNMLTVQGTGATAITVAVDTQDNAFFKNDISSWIQSLFFNTSNNLPFLQTNPSQSFYDPNAAGGLGAWIEPSWDACYLGTAVNGICDSDIIFQSDANNSFALATRQVPEPAGIALFGFGLLAAGLVLGRRPKIEQAQALLATSAA